MSCESLAHLRRATADDAAGIAAVHVRTWQHAYQGMIPVQVLDGLSVTRRQEFWARELRMLHDERRPWIAECDGRIVGFVSTGPSRDEGAGARTAEVYAIYVDPECWSRGIGRSLMDHARRDLKQAGYEAATLWVLSANTVARDFYDAGGWHVDGQERIERMGGAELEEVRYRTALT